LPNIETLIEDIYGLFNGHEYDPGDVQAFGLSVADTITKRIGRDHGPPALRMSNLGTPCERKLWYTVNEPEHGEPFDAQTKLKFLYGDILEELLLFLASASGHEVVGRQDELEILGVKGHPDAIIDGRLVDVKSASSYSFQKFKNHDLRGNDPFGYLDQLGAYLYASRDNPALVDKNKASFLVIDKTLGHLTLDTYRFDLSEYPQKVQQKIDAVAGSKPPREYDDEPDGKSGNRKLGTTCGYCAFKSRCWPELRTFLYGNGPRFLTRVARLPDVHEVK
jgi:hypothetical protein